jgi:hypothetical protein
MNTPKYLTILGCVMLMTAPAYPQTGDRPATTNNAATVAAAAQAQDQSAPDVTVTGVEVKDPKPGHEKDVALGNFVILKLSTPWKTVLKLQKSPTNKLGLFINDLFMKGLEPLPVPDDPNAVMFQFKRNDDNRDAWSLLFGRKGFFPWSPGNKDLKLTVGLQDGSWAAKEPQVLNLEYLPNSGYSWVVLIVSSIVAILTIIKGKTSPSMLRDTGEPPTNGERAYSLARFQMALWFVTVVFAFAFTYAVTGDMSPIPQGTLILMGIGAGTALGAAAIDLNKRTASRTDQANSTAEKDSASKQIQDLQTKISSAAGDPNQPILQQQLADAQKRLASATTQLSQIPSTQALPTKGFFNDVLSDENGISFHRLQVFGWTLVFWTVFVSSLFKRVTMADFDATQLALMGISGSTYLGFKLQEK